MKILALILFFNDLVYYSQKEEEKYIPINILNASDNYMSYIGNLRKSTWHWQIKIVHNNIEK